MLGGILGVVDKVVKNFCFFEVRILVEEDWKNEDKLVIVFYIRMWRVLGRKIKWGRYGLREIGGRVEVGYDFK